MWTTSGDAHAQRFYFYIILLYIDRALSTFFHQIGNKNHPEANWIVKRACLIAAGATRPK
jgi:hypothetical protein